MSAVGPELRLRSIMAGPLSAKLASTSPRWRLRVRVWAGRGACGKLDPASSSWKADLTGAIAAFSVHRASPRPPRTRQFRIEDEENVRLARGGAGVHPHPRVCCTKAESSDFAEEADAFMAKAQELMTRYCIDRTMVDADAGGDGPSRVEARRVWLRGSLSRGEGAPAGQPGQREPMPRLLSIR